jgi:hypothetical protein
MPFGAPRNSYQDRTRRNWKFYKKARIVGVVLLALAVLAAYLQYLHFGTLQRLGNHIYVLKFSAVVFGLSAITFGISELAAQRFAHNYDHAATSKVGREIMDTDPRDLDRSSQVKRRISGGG